MTLRTTRILLCCALLAAFGWVGTAAHAADYGSDTADRPVSRNLHLADLQPLSVSAYTAKIVFTQQGCTVTDTCPGGGGIQCSGTTCSTASVTCSDGGSTCPEQGGTAKAVRCDGVIQDACPCPEVCYGCGASCTSHQQCASVCSCGPGFCSGGQCICPY